MTVTGATLAVQLGLPANDTKADRAATAALSWARKTLDLDGDADLDDVAGFGADNWEAVRGYAQDVMKLDKVQFGYFDTGDEIAGNVAARDIGRHWRPMLTYGTTRTFGFA